MLARPQSLKSLRSSLCLRECKLAPSHERHGVYQHNWYIRNKEKKKAQCERWRIANRDRVNELARACYQRTKPRYAAYQKMWQAANREHAAKYSRERLSIPAHRLAHGLRARLRCAILKGSASPSMRELLGCTFEALTKRLESMFLPGMSWSNYGRDGWHVDHIKPLSKFDLTNERQLKKACSYKNLQPLWAYDNLSKGAKHGS